MATEATETRAALHRRLSEALEASLGTKAVWRKEAVGTCREHGQWAEDEVIVDSGLRCPTCFQTVSWDVQRSPVDWDDPAILWPRWERWATQWMQGPRPSSSILPMDVVQRTVRGAANAWAEVGVWTSRDGAPTVTAALATAWDALLAREVRDD